MWARQGTRPSQVRDQRYASVYLFGATCPERDIGAALVLPRANAQAMQLHLDEISHHIKDDAHAVLVLDQAGWHGATELKWPGNISPLPLPSVSPELNPVENVWQYLRQTYLSNRVFENEEAILDACCAAWNALIASDGRIKSITSREWANLPVST